MHRYKLTAESWGVDVIEKVGLKWRRKRSGHGIRSGKTAGGASTRCAPRVRTRSR